VIQSPCQRYVTESKHQRELIVQLVDKAGQNRVTRIKQSIPTPQDDPRKFSKKEALSLVLDFRKRNITSFEVSY
jgi:hypothetical protein